jgi:hypothetical protein
MGQAHDRPWRQLACGKDAIISVLKEYGYIPCGSDLSNGYDFLADKFRWAPVIGLSGFTNRTYGISTSASGPAAGSSVAQWLLRAFRSGQNSIRSLAMSTWPEKCFFTSVAHDV